MQVVCQLKYRYCEQDNPLGPDQNNVHWILYINGVKMRNGLQKTQLFQDIKKTCLEASLEIVSNFLLLCDWKAEKSMEYLAGGSGSSLFTVLLMIYT